MQKPSPDDVLEALCAVRLPAGGDNIVDAGMISGLSAQEGEGGLHVQLVIDIDPAQAEQMEPVRLAAEKAVCEMGGVAGATVILSAHKAAPAMGGPANKKAKEKAGSVLPKGIKRIIAVASGKGGVGKSTTAVNLSLALQAQGLCVGLLDVDVYGPSVPRLLGYDQIDVEEDEQGMMIPPRPFGLPAMSIGFLTDPDMPMLWRGPMVHSALQKMLFGTAWGLLDVLVLDMPPGTGDAALSIAQQVPLSGAVIVSTPQDLALLDVRKGIGMFHKVDVPVWGMIENMSHFECPHCHQITPIFGHGGARADAERMGLDYLGDIPLTLDVRESADFGRPIVLSSPEGAQAARYVAIAAKLRAKLS